MSERYLVFGPHSRAKRELALELRRSMTAAEETLWQRLKADRLGGLHFRRQQVIHGYIVDFYCHQRRLAVEVDGEVHRSQRQRDQTRDELLAEAGVRVLRFTNEQVTERVEEVLQAILQAAEA